MTGEFLYENTLQLHACSLGGKMPKVSKEKNKPDRIFLESWSIMIHNSDQHSNIWLGTQ